MMRMRNLALMSVVILATCAMAQAQAWPSLFLSWPIQDIERRQAMAQAGFPALVVTTRPDAPVQGQADASREVVGVATDPNGMNRIPWDSELEVHLSYAMSGGSVKDAYAVVGGAQAEKGRALPEPDQTNRFGHFDPRTQILRISYADKVELQRRYAAINPGMFREDLPLQIVSVDPTGERKDTTTQAFWTLFIPIRTVSKRPAYMSQTFVVHWENQHNWVYGCAETAPSTARELREQIAALRMWQRSSVAVSGDAFAARLFAAIEPQMQVWISSPQVVVEYLNRRGAPTAGPRLTGLVLFFPRGSIVSKPWLPGQPVEWRRLVGTNVRFPSYIEELLVKCPNVDPYILVWRGDRSHAHFLIHQATFAALPDGLKCGFLAISQPVADRDVRWWDWAEGGADGAVVPLAPGAIERRLIQETDTAAPRFSQETNFSDLLFGVRPEAVRPNEDTVTPPTIRP